MQDEKYSELENRAAMSEVLDDVRNHEAHARVRDVIAEMKREGKALVLTAEEEEMLWSFRRFKTRMRKSHENFTWATRRPDGVQIVEETSEVVHPSEACR